MLKALVYPSISTGFSVEVVILIKRGFWRVAASSSRSDATTQTHFQTFNFVIVKFLINTETPTTSDLIIEYSEIIGCQDDTGASRGHTTSALRRVVQTPGFSDPI
jgi:hypothetical protein